MKKKLFITGASNGIAAGLLDYFSNKYDDIINIDILSPEDSMKKYWKGSVDIRDYEAVFSLMESEFAVDCEFDLISSAGVVYLTDGQNEEVKDFINMPILLLHQMVEINLKGQINVLHSFLSLLNKYQKRGNIIVISSISAFHSGGPNMAVYDATKAAITALAKRLVPYNNVTINIIEPGSVRSEIGSWKKDFTVDQGGRTAVKSGQDADAKQLEKEVSITNIAELCNFLLFANHNMNGAELVIDAGLTLIGRPSY